MNRTVVMFCKNISTLILIIVSNYFLTSCVISSSMFEDYQTDIKLNFVSLKEQVNSNEENIETLKAELQEKIDSDAQILQNSLTGLNKKLDNLTRQISFHVNNSQQEFLNYDIFLEENVELCKNEFSRRLNLYRIIVKEETESVKLKLNRHLQSITNKIAGKNEKIQEAIDRIGGINRKISKVKASFGKVEKDQVMVRRKHHIR